MDKKQQNILIGVIAAVVLAAVAFAIFRPKGDPATTNEGTTETSKSGAGGSGTGAKTTTVAALPPLSNEKPNLAKLGAPRKDPFYVDWRELPPPPNVFESVEPIRLASPSVTAPPTEVVEVRETPSRRFAGFMNGDGIYAILEGNGETEIVQPGSTTTDGFKVVSITTDVVLLRKQEGNVIYTQQVNYGDAPAGAISRPAGNFPGNMGGAFRPGASGPGGARRGGGKGGGSEE